MIVPPASDVAAIGNPALELLEGESMAKTAAVAAKDSAMTTVNAARRLATEPVETLQELPAGTWRFLKRRMTDIAGTAVDLTDRGRDAITGDDELYDHTSMRPGTTAPDPNPPEAWWETGGRGLASLARDWIGYGKARRELARRLGVDPYSTNPLLNERMEELAWSAVAGNQTVSLATGQIGGVPAVALGATQRVNKILWELPPKDIARINRTRLTQLGCGKIELRRFLRNRHFNPSLQTALTDAMVELQPVSGCVQLIELAAAGKSELEARYMVDALTMLAARGVRGGELFLIDTAPVMRVYPREPAVVDSARSPHVFDMRQESSDDLGRWTAALPARPRLLLPLPVDHLQWSPGTQAFFDRVEFRVVDKIVLIGGDATINAVQGLTRRGWEIAEHAAP